LNTVSCGYVSNNVTTQPWRRPLQLAKLKIVSPRIHIYLRAFIAVSHIWLHQRTVRAPLVYSLMHFKVTLKHILNLAIRQSEKQPSGNKIFASRLYKHLSVTRKMKNENNTIEMFASYPVHI
jgi:hypothetical protein